MAHHHLDGVGLRVADLGSTLPMKGPSHYCQGKWVKGKSKDCPEPVHNVKLAKE